MLRLPPLGLALTALACGASPPVAPAPAPPDEPARCEAPAPDAERALSAYGRAVSWDELRAMYRVLGLHELEDEEQGSGEPAAFVLESAIARELLVEEGLRRGLVLDVAGAMTRVRSEQVVLLSSHPRDAVPVDLVRGGAFDESALIDAVRRRWGLTMPVFARWQGREALALRARDELLADVTVDDDAVFAEYAADQDYARVRYVVFRPRYFEPLRAEPAALAAFRAEHAAELAAEYERNRHRYTGLEEERRARHLLIRIPEGSTDVAGLERRAQDLLRQARRRGADFAALARAHSEDPGSAPRGGDLGWTPRGRMVEEFEAALFEARRPGVIPRVVRTRFGLHLIEVTGIRAAGDVPREEVERELAERAFLEEEGREAARRAAAEMLAAWRAGGAPEALVARYAGADADAFALQETLVRRPREPPADVRLSGRGPAGDELTPEQLQVLLTRLRGLQDAAAESFRPALALEAGDFGEAPIAHDTGWTVFQVVERHVPRREELEPAMRAQIAERLIAPRRRARLAEIVAELRAAAEASGCLHVDPQAHAIAPERLRRRPRGGP